MILQPAIFREYDIRGVVGKDFDAKFAHALGVVFARQVLQSPYAKNTAEPQTVAVGWDCRLSGPELSSALIAGLRAGGVNVLSCGMGPTPQLYYATFSKNLGGGIQVTGSHNPGDQNGFKMMIGTHTLSGAEIQSLKTLIANADHEQIASAAGILTEWNAREAYIDELVKRSTTHINQAKKLKIVVDGGNGVGGLVGPEVLRRLGCEVIELYTEPDGRFPNHHPDPTVPENIVDLRKAVAQHRADAGIAWDGDADRIGVVSDKGEIIWGDMLLILFGKELQKEIPNPIVIGDVKCSELLFSELEKVGARPIMWKTGHSLIKAKLKETGAHLAGEMSGHIFFAHRYYGFDDALHSSARLVELLSHAAQPLSAMLAELPKMVSTPEIRVDCPEKIKFKVAERAKDLFPEYKTNTIDGVRVSFPDGWGLVRASNTQPVLVMRFEAGSESELNQYQSLFQGRVQKLVQELASAN
ncbi:phosphomannomutase/phosphoglucomutase [bacterium]|nr:phosphomannomutase/phosphoglucomutase [bacterium]